MPQNLKPDYLWKRQSHEILNSLFRDIYGTLLSLPGKRRELIWALDNVLIGNCEAIYNEEHTQVLLTKKELTQRAFNTLAYRNFIVRFKLNEVIVTCTEYYKVQSIRNLLSSNEPFFVEIKGDEVFINKEISLGDETFNQRPYILTVTHFAVKNLQHKLSNGRYTREQLELII